MNNSDVHVAIPRYGSVASLIVLGVDYILTLKFEYRCVWRQPLSRATSLYLLARYLPLGFQIANYVTIHRLVLPLRNGGSISTRQCVIWFNLLQFACTLTGTILNLILFLRLYALYQKNKKTLALLFLVLLEIGCSIALAYSNFRAAVSSQPHRVFTDVCTLHASGHQAVYAGVCVLLTQASFWIAAHARRNVAAGRSIIVRLVVHQGTWIFALLSGIAAGFTPYTIASSSANPFVIFVWPITIMSITSCRLIMSSLSLAIEKPTQDPAPNIELAGMPA